MAEQPKKVIVQASRVDDTMLPPIFSLAYRLYVIQQGGDLKNVADASNNANDLAYQATVKNDEQDITLGDHETRITGLRTDVDNQEVRISNIKLEVDDHEVRITANATSITQIEVRVTNVEGSITTLSGRVSTAESDISGVKNRLSTAESNISTINSNYVSKSVTALQTISSPISVSTSYSVNGTKVVGPRETGWTAAVGAAIKGFFDSNASFPVGATYDQALVTAIANGLIESRRRIKALEDSLRTHGLIN